ncbi:MAG TPA: DUF2938 domain-containing protein [Ilumatobacteraceae bacterium]|jgi:hypothetical protein
MFLFVVDAVLIGLGATLLIDIWAVFLKRVFSIRSLDYCLLGRWVLYIPHGTIVHRNITATPAKPHECKVGWTTHYLIGTVLALIFALLASDGWLVHPTILPAVAFGIATVVMPFFTLQPSFGLGVAASKTPSPTKARLKSLMTHTVFGVGMYAWAFLLSRFLFT